MNWWNEPGTEVCGHCLQRYAYEIEYRCSWCDGPLCPMCVVYIRGTRRPVCPECLKSGEEE